MTIFTAPKPFKDAHISMIQRNAIQSWMALGPEVEVILMGKEEGMAEVAADLGVKYRPDVACNELGTPLISSMFALACQSSDSPLLLCINADIILLPEILEVAHQIANQAEQFLAIGQRWDMDIRQPLSFVEGWVNRLSLEVQQRGREHPGVGSDYFIFPRACYTRIPDFVIGRSAWDNWMIYYARQQHIPVVNVTSSTIVIHQDHDYSHLPGGKPPYRLPETLNNIRLAGGRRTIFYIDDADCYVQDGHLHQVPIRGRKLWREIEIFPLIQLHSWAMTDIFFSIFHPIKSWKEWHGRLTYKLKRNRNSHD